jgi:hypothetical protein
MLEPSPSPPHTLGGSLIERRVSGGVGRPHSLNQECPAGVNRASKPGGARMVWVTVTYHSAAMFHVKHPKRVPKTGGTGGVPPYRLASGLCWGSAQCRTVDRGPNTGRGRGGGYAYVACSGDGGIFGRLAGRGYLARFAKGGFGT